MKIENFDAVGKLMALAAATNTDESVVVVTGIKEGYTNVLIGPAQVRLKLSDDVSVKPGDQFVFNTKTGDIISITPTIDDTLAVTAKPAPRRGGNPSMVRNPTF